MIQRIDQKQGSINFIRFIISTQYMAVTAAIILNRMSVLSVFDTEHFFVKFYASNNKWPMHWLTLQNNKQQML